MKKVCLLMMLFMLLFASAANALMGFESQIDGNFEGFKYDNVYKLTNGQIWVQTEYYYYYYYSYMPQVFIFQANNGYYYMKVDGIDQAVAVQQLR